MKLTNIRPIGRYKNTLTGQTVNVKKGTKSGGRVDFLFYLYKGQRIFLNELDFYKEWRKEDANIHNSQ